MLAGGEEVVGGKEVVELPLDKSFRYLGNDGYDGDRTVI